MVRNRCGLLAAAVPALGADATAGNIVPSAMQYLPYGEPGRQRRRARTLSHRRIRPSRCGRRGVFIHRCTACAHLTWDAATLKRFLLRHRRRSFPAPPWLFPCRTSRSRHLVAFSKIWRAPNPAPRRKPAQRADRTEYRGAGREPSIGRLETRRPGPRNRIDLATSTLTLLPHPPPATDPSSLRDRPCSLALPPGFHIEPFAANLEGPRNICWSLPTATFWVTETVGDAFPCCTRRPDGTRAAGADVYVPGLKQPFWSRVLSDADHPRWLYVAETNRVTTLRLSRRRCEAGREAEVVIPQLPSGGGHFTRDIAFSPDGTQLFVSVGSASNVAESMSKKGAGRDQSV